MIEKISNKNPLAFSLISFLYAIQMPIEKKDIEVTIGKSLEEIDLVDTRNFLLAKKVNTSVKSNISKNQIKPQYVPAIFTDGEIAQLIIKGDDGELLEVDDKGTRDLSKQAVQGRLIYISEQIINPSTTLFDLLLSRRKKLILKLYALSAFLAVTSLSLPIIIKLYYSIIVPSKASISGLIILSIGVLLAVYESKIKGLRTKLIINSQVNIEKVLISAVTKKFISLEASEISLLGNIGLKTYYKKAENVSNFIHGSLAKTLFDAPFIFIYLLVVYVFAGMVVVIPIILMIIALIIVLVMSKLNYKLRIVDTKAGLGLSGIEKEILQKRTSIQLGAVEWLWMQRLRGLSAENIKNKISIGSQNYQLKILSETTLQIAITLTLVLGALVAIQSEDASSLANITATIFVLWKIFTPFQYLMSTVLQWEFFISQYKELEVFMKNIITSSSREKANFHRRFNGDIELVRCNTQYKSNNQVGLHDMSVKIKRGTITVLAGNDESTKKSIFETITHLNRLRSGSILFDGIDSRQYDEDEIQENIAFVCEKPALFTGMYYDNLTLMNPHASAESIDQINEKLKLNQDPYIMDLTPSTFLTHDLISRLPNGSKRMLSLAQGLIKKSPILLLEEIGRGLNPKQFEIITQFLYDERRNESPNRSTIVYSTTNPRLIDCADVIIVIMGGKAVFQGSPQELSQKMRNFPRSID